MGQLRLLDNEKTSVRRMGKIGAAYLAQRLLGTQPSLSPRLDNISRIASRFAQENVDANAGVQIESAERYAEYIRTLSSLVASESSRLLCNFFTPDPWASESFILEYDFLAAAAYTGRLSIVRELSERERNTVVDVGTMGSPPSSIICSNKPAHTIADPGPFS